MGYVTCGITNQPKSCYTYGKDESLWLGHLFLSRPADFQPFLISVRLKKWVYKVQTSVTFSIE
jgi:hypothetical protein